MTRVEQGNNIEYECELEIADVNYFMSKVGDIIALRKLVRKFLLNQIYISKIIDVLYKQTLG